MKISYQNQSPVERFSSRYTPEPNSGCWLWTGALKNKYGSFRMGNHSMAHRASWKIHRGNIPSGMDVCHKCDVRICVNPDHLFIGTRSDNMKDCVSKKRHVSFRHDYVPRHGESVHCAKITSEMARDIRDLRKSGMLQREIGEKFGITQAAVSYLLMGKSWKRA